MAVDEFCVRKLSCGLVQWRSQSCSGSFNTGERWTCFSMSSACWSPPASPARVVTGIVIAVNNFSFLKSSVTCTAPFAGNDDTSMTTLLAADDNFLCRAVSNFVLQHDTSVLSSTVNELCLSLFDQFYLLSALVDGVKSSWVKARRMLLNNFWVTMNKTMSWCCDGRTTV